MCVEPAALPDFKAGVPLNSSGGFGTHTPASSFNLPASSCLPSPGCRRGWEWKGSGGREGGSFAWAEVKSCCLLGMSPAAGNRGPCLAAPLKSLGPSTPWFVHQEDDVLLRSVVEISPAPQPLLTGPKPQPPSLYSRPWLGGLFPHDWEGLEKSAGASGRSLAEELITFSAGPSTSSNPLKDLARNPGPQPSSSLSRQEVKAAAGEGLAAPG